MTKKVRPVPANLVIPASKPKPDPINNSELVTGFRAGGGKIFHLRPDDYRTIGGRPRRGMTVAFVIRSGHVELATAVQHRSDVFARKVGTRTAIQHFQQGKTISLPITTYNKGSEMSTLQSILGALL